MKTYIEIHRERQRGRLIGGKEGNTYRQRKRYRWGEIHRQCERQADVRGRKRSKRVRMIEYLRTTSCFLFIFCSQINV